MQLYWQAKIWGLLHDPIFKALYDLRTPPGNRLEQLSGDRSGQYSIRINNQWRICFSWNDENNAIDVEIVDYH
jgi:toxin HigB-1